MNKENITTEVVQEIYHIFNNICKPKRLNELEKNFPSDYMADQIRHSREEGDYIEIRVSSEYAPFGPKLLFTIRPNNLVEVHFSPNLDWSNRDEQGLIPKAEELSKQFSQCVKSYFRKIDRLSL